MMSALTGMDAANASHYDGGTSLAESVTVALEVSRYKRRKILLSHAIHPQYREIVRTYQTPRGIQIEGDETPATIAELADRVDENTAMLAVSYPNFFGQIEDFSGLAEKVHAKGALLVFVTNPTALGLLKSPGQLGADIVVGEGQPLGIPLGFGGPYLGFFAVREKHVRKIAGRIVGETRDTEDRRAYVLTLRPREQDIKREKASSNICTNQGLMALAAAVYLSLMGKNGLKKVAELCYHKAHYAADQIDRLDGFRVDRSRPFFHEFVVECPTDVRAINERLAEEGIVGGYDLGRDYPHLATHMLLCVTEMNRKEEIDALVGVLSEVKAS
jgi:glycine dehydrogenase subunit 1